MDYTKYLDSLKDGDYTKAEYGSDFLKQIAYEILCGGRDKSIEESLLKACKAEYREYTGHKPLYRLGKQATNGNSPQEFEVLVLTGSPTYEGEDTSRFKFGAAMMVHAASKVYEDRCKSTEVIHDPSEKELLDAIEKKAKSVKKHGRKLYIVYIGHGEYDDFQKGIKKEDESKEGSRAYKFILKKIPSCNEEYFKKILNEHLGDLETTILINSCHSGSAVTDRLLEARIKKAMGIA